jgi:PKD repeat protein
MVAEMARACSEDGSRRPGRGWRRLLVPLAVSALLLAGLGSPGAVADTAPQDPGSPETPPTVSADALPTVQINGVVWSQAMVGDIVYAGGSFSNARPAGSPAGSNTVARTNMLAYNVRTGVMTSFAPTFNAQVKAVTVSPDGSRIYVGGDFTTVNGVSQRRIAAFNAATGQLITNFNPPINYHVNALAVTNTTVYAGGEFQDVGTQVRQGLAAFNASNGALLNWTPAATGGDVWALALNPAGTKLAVGGAFTALNGSSNPGYGLGMVDAQTGASLPFLANNIVRNGTADGAITTLTADDEYIYGGGYTFGRSGGTWEGVFSASWTDGAVHWANDCHGDTYSLHAEGDVVYAASHTHYCENIDGIRQGAGGVGDYPYFRGIAFGRDVTGTASWEPDQGRYYSFEGQPRSSVLTWYPNLNAGTYTGQIQGPWSVTGNSDYIAMGGEFTRVNGQNQQGLVRFARPGLAPNDQGPSLFNATYPLNLRSTEAGKVRIGWATNEDIDNDYLTYRVYRDVQSGAGLIHTRSVRARWWNPYGMGFTDTGLAPGSTHRYRVAVTDPFGNIANSPWTNVTVASTGSDGPYVEAVEGSEPTHWWRLDETSGTTLADSAGFQPLTTTAGPTLGVPDGLAADTGSAVRFPGTSTTRAYTTVQDSPPDVFTLEAWFRTTTGGGKIIGRGNRNDRNSSKMDRQIYLTNSGQVVFGVKPNQNRQVVTSPASYNNGSWHHVAASLSPAGMKLYVDGALVGQRADVTVGEHLALGYWRIGGDALNNWPSAPTNAFFNGDLDEVAVYYRALSAGEIAAHHAAGANSPPPNQPPTADFTSSVSGMTAQFTSTAADEDGTVESYAWSFGDGGTSTEEDPSHAYDGPGTYNVTLTVTDDDGGTGSVTKAVMIEEPANIPPTVDFTSSVSGMTAQFTSAAADEDGTVESYAWAFGDGDTSTEGDPSHTYDGPGTYDVTLTVTDDDGGTGTATHQVLVSSGPTPFAVDSFDRGVANGWGSADTGGPWTRAGTASNFAVSGSQGRIRMGSGGSGPSMALTGVSSADTDLRVRVGADKAATGGGTYLTAEPRRLANGNRYFADVRLLSTGAVSVTIGRTVGGTDTTLQTQTVAGLTVGAGDLVNLRVQATGTSPTTVRAKVWATSAPEPAGWNVSSSDATAVLQSAGHIGLRVYLSGSATNAPVWGLFDDLVAGPA